MSYYDKGQELVRAGYIPIPIKPGGKHPAGVKGWQKADQPCIRFGYKPVFHRTFEAGELHKSGQYITHYYRHLLTDPEFADYGTGILLGGEYNLIGIDIDATDPDTAKQFEQAIRDVIPMDDCIIRYGNPPKFTVICRTNTTEIPTTHSSTAQYDILSTGSQTVIDGLHPANIRYSINHLPNSADLPIISKTQIENLISKFSNITATPKKDAEGGKRGAGGLELARRGTAYSRAEERGFDEKGGADRIMEKLGDGDRKNWLYEYANIFEDMRKPNGRKKEYEWAGYGLANRFNRIPIHYWDDYDFWVMAGMALHDVNDNEKMYELWTTMSMVSTAYNPKHQRQTWNSFEITEDKKRITMGSISYIADKVSGQTKVDYGDIDLFLNGCVAEGVRVSVSELYRCYLLQGGSLSQRVFTAYLARTGYTKKKVKINGKAENFWIGIKLTGKGLPGYSTARNFIKEMEL